MSQPEGQETSATEPVAEPHAADTPAVAQPQSARTNSLAIASFALSLSGLTFLAQIAGIITGHMALNQIRQTGEAGHGLAKAGLIISYVTVGVSVLFIVFFVALWGIMLATLLTTFGAVQPGMMDYMVYSS